MTVETKRISTRQRCYDKFRRLLMYGQLPPGLRLAELEWSERLSAPRAAVREAMVLLAHEGLLARGPRGGFFTPVLEQRDIDEVWEARMVVEVGAIRLIAARQPDEETLRPLADICDTMQHMLDVELVMGFAEADRKFHEKLVELSGNERLTALYQRSALPLLPRGIDPESIRHDGRQTIQEHRDIHRLILEQQIGDAVAVLEEHLHTSNRLAPIF